MWECPPTVRECPSTKVYPKHVIGGGLEIKKSCIAGAGRGLFACADFKSNEIITKYEGKDITFEEAKAMSNQKYIMQHTGKFIDGIKEPIIGKGAGSFANSSIEHANTEKCLIGNDIWLKVKRGKHIQPGDEVLQLYSRQFHKNLLRSQSALR